jgi:hypothetical protein
VLVHSSSIRSRSKRQSSERVELGAEACEVEEEIVGVVRQGQEVEVSSRVTAVQDRRLTMALEVDAVGLTEDEGGIEVVVVEGEEGIVDEGNADEGVGTKWMESTGNQTRRSGRERFARVNDDIVAKSGRGQYRGDDKGRK